MAIKHKVELYKSENGHRMTIYSTNGQIIFANGQGIANRQDIIEMFGAFIESIRNNTFIITENDKDITAECSNQSENPYAQ